MSEKSTANVRPSRPVSGMFFSSHPPVASTKPYRESQPDTRSCTRLRSDCEASSRRGRDRSLTSVDFPVTISEKRVARATHSGLLLSPKTPLRKSSQVTSIDFFSILSIAALPCFGLHC